MATNERAAVIAGIAGLLMLGSGVTGASQWRHTFAFLADVLGTSLDASPLLRFVAYVFIALGSVGGVFVLLGAYAFRQDRVRTGRLLIWFGTGFTLASIVLFLAIQARRGDWPFVGAGVLGFLGLVLSVVARIRAKPVPRKPTASGAGPRTP